MAVNMLTTLGISELPIPGAEPWFANAEDPAVSVMTDFRARSSVTVSDAATVDMALEHMKHAGVRCAFAIDDERRVVVGMITAYDILSEKPMRHMQSVDSPRREVLVRDIMQRVLDWRVADIKEIEKMTVGAVYQLLDSARLTHLPVTESFKHGPRLRGLLSTAKLRRLLGR